MGEQKNESRTSHPVNQQCEHRLSRLEYATFDERRGIVRSLEEGITRFDDIEKQISDLSNRIQTFEESRSNHKYLDKLLVRLASAVVIVIELFPVVRDALKSVGGN